MSNKLARVSISTGETPNDALREGITNLGGISQFIGENEKVFIKINLNMPTGFPSNVNLDTLCEVIRLCKQAGAQKIYVGSFAFENFTVKKVSDELGLSEFIEFNEGELAYLDNSDKIGTIKLSDEDKLQLQPDSFREIEILDSRILYPQTILDSDKLICINQVNVHPVFDINLAVLNLYSCIHYKYRRISHDSSKEKSALGSDQFRSNLVAKIFDVYNVKKPNLVINDLFYFMEGAGPFIYKDSKIKLTKYIISGNDAVATDYITLKILGLEPRSNPIISYARKKKMGTTQPEKINLFGEKIDDIDIGFKPCAKKLEDINLQKFVIKKGVSCSGCFLHAYYLLNFIKSLLIKDLNYLPNCSFLMGENPLEPEESTEIILFGDCAINSTINRDFRIIKKEGRNIKSFFLKKEILYKTNKKMLPIPGCPPNLIYDNFNLILKYFKKSNLPTLNFYMKNLKFIPKSES